MLDGSGLPMPGLLGLECISGFLCPVLRACPRFPVHPGFFQSICLDETFSRLLSVVVVNIIRHKESIVKSLFVVVVTFLP